eukprot:jgi/Ulvmu1/11916/UM081_0076.1
MLRLRHGDRESGLRQCTCDTRGGDLHKPVLAIGKVFTQRASRPVQPSSSESKRITVSENKIHLPMLLRGLVLTCLCQEYTYGISTVVYDLYDCLLTCAVANPLT